jgi:hypothetical protein
MVLSGSLNLKQFLKMDNQGSEILALSASSVDESDVDVPMDEIGGNEHLVALEEIGGENLYNSLLNCIASLKKSDALIADLSEQFMQNGAVTYEYLSKNQYWFESFMRSSVIKTDLLKKLVRDCSIMGSHLRPQKRGNLLLLTL